MLSIQDRLSIGILFNGQEFPFNRINSMDFLHMAASSKIAIPMIHLKLRDVLGWISRTNALFDGTIITVTIAPRNHEAIPYNFRLNSYKEQRVGDSVSYEIDGYLDIPRYWFGSQQEPINGTSSSALEEIARQCNLLPQVDNTSNEQQWLPRNRQYHQWAREIAASGYVSDSSCMILATDFDKSLRYLNINASRNVTAHLSLVNRIEGAIHVVSHKPVASSGTSNHVGGYNNEYVQQMPLEDNRYRVHRRIDVRNDEKGNMMMSGEIKNVSPHTNVQFGPIDPGNVGETYERGVYQNRRMQMLYSVGLEVLTPELTNLGVLAVVELSTPEHESVRMYSGRYVVAARTIYVQGIDYYEKLLLIRKTLNTEGTPGSVTGSEGPLHEDLAD